MLAETCRESCQSCYGADCGTLNRMSTNLPDRRDTPIEGELQRHALDPEDCPIETYESVGTPYRFQWHCTGGVHAGRGAHVTEAGRQRGITEHRQQYTEDRHLTGRWRPV